MLKEGNHFLPALGLGKSLDEALLRFPRVLANLPFCCPPPDCFRFFFVALDAFVAGGGASAGPGPKRAAR